jgi:hypothetical protein
VSAVAGASRRAVRLPAAVRGRFPGYPESVLSDPAHRDFLASRLMEEGSGEELRWLVDTVGAAMMASLLERRGGRLLSRRSRAFWSRVLRARSGAPHELAAELWPLA